MSESNEADHLHLVCLGDIPPGPRAIRTGTAYGILTARI
jgi:hypothetical protein